MREGDKTHVSIPLEEQTSGALSNVMLWNVTVIICGSVQLPHARRSPEPHADQALHDRGEGKKVRCTSQPLQSTYELQEGLKKLNLFISANSA